MPPIRLHFDWNQRPTDRMLPIEPFRKYFIICEGANTEFYYFKKLISIKKEVGIHSLIDLVFMEKTEEHKDLSYPKTLIEFALEERKKLIAAGVFEAERDIMIVVFDLDIFKDKVKHLAKLYELQDEHFWFGVTFPSFELFLLLRIENSVEQILLPHYMEFIENEKIGNQRPCQYYLRKATGMNSKTNERIGELACYLDIAIAQEKQINQDLDQCFTQVTSTIGSILEKVKEERIPYAGERKTLA